MIIEIEEEHAMKIITTLAVSSAVMLLLAGAANATVVLSSLSNPPNKIAYARVVDEKGTTVGAAQRVELDANRRPSKVEFALLGTEKIVALDSSKLSYDEPKNVLTVNLEKGQIVQLAVIPRG
jgi:hypothetical protein